MARTWQVGDLLTWVYDNEKNDNRWSEAVRVQDSEGDWIPTGEMVIPQKGDTGLVVGYDVGLTSKYWKMVLLLRQGAHIMVHSSENTMRRKDKR